MNTSRPAFRLILFLLLIPVLFSCKKELNLVGLDLVSPEELLKLGYNDTVKITAYSVQEDSVKTANLSYALMGSMNDPVFGVTTASWFGQIRISTEPADFGSYPVFDSAFLLLPYSSAYGDTMSNMTLRVYHLTETIIDSVHRYSNNTIGYDAGNPLGELTFSPRPHDSAYFDGEKQAPILRIPLNSNFGLLTLAIDTAYLTNNTEFVDYFKGIAIVAEKQNETGKGSILKMVISGGSSKIKMYYHNLADTSSYIFNLNSDCLSFNHFDHEGYQSASPFLKQEISGDTTMGEQFLFLQTMGGVRTKIRFPYLKDWFKNQKVIINDAELILTNSSVSSTFTPPSYLSLYPVASDGSLDATSLPDSDEGSSYYGGTYDATTGRYIFRLTRYVQQVLTGAQTDYGLYLIIPGASITGGRLVLNGPGAPADALKLYLKYTIIN